MTVSKIPDLRVQPLIDIEFEEIDDEGLRKKARDLRELLPELSISFIYHTLMTFHGDADIAAAALLMDDLPVEFRSNVTKLKKCFPGSRKHQARNALITERGDYEAAEKRVQNELALDQATAQIAIPPQHEPSKNPTKASSSPPRTVTLTATTSHVNGVVKSFQISTKTHTTSAAKSKRVAKPVTIDLTKEVNESQANSYPKRSSSPCPTFIKNEEADNSAKDISDEDDLQGSQKQEWIQTARFTKAAVGLHELFPELSFAFCEDTLEECRGDEVAAFERLDRRCSPNTSRSSTTLAAGNGDTNGAISQGSNEAAIVDFFAKKLPGTPVTDAENDEEGPLLVEEVPEEKVTNLYESLQQKVPTDKCKKALRMNNGDVQRAYATLSAEYGVDDDTDGEAGSGETGPGCRRRHLHRGDSPSLADRERRGRRQVSLQNCGSPRDTKRRAEGSVRTPHSLLNSVIRTNSTFRSPALPRGLACLRSRTRLTTSQMQTRIGMKSRTKALVLTCHLPDNGCSKLIQSFRWYLRLTLAHREIYPERTSVTLVFGDDLVTRDNIPKKVLCDNFDFLKHSIESAANEESGPSQTRVTIPHVSGGAFDLVTQFMIRGDITLEGIQNEERISSILALIDAAIKLFVPSHRLGALVHNMVSKLKAILSADYLALIPCHIRKAYELEDGPYIREVQDLFVSATVKRRVLYKREKTEIISPFEDDDDDDMSAAQKASYSGTNFIFDREMRDFPQFGKALWYAVHECWDTRVHETKNPRRGIKKDRIIYTDPLTKKVFEL